MMDVLIGAATVFVGVLTVVYIRRRDYQMLVRDFDDRHAKWGQFRHSREGRTETGPAEEFPLLENAISALDTLAYFLLQKSLCLLDRPPFMERADRSLKVKMKTPYERYVNLSKDKQNPTPYKNADELYRRWYPDEVEGREDRTE